jgi:DNA-binding transcriptional regulator LsrR (DeoR family)
MHTAARLYYVEHATQADIATRLGMSRPAVSRLLAEARRTGMVRIEIVPPIAERGDALEARLKSALGLRRVRIAPPAAGPTGAALAPALCEALRAAGLVPGDAVVISSGRTIYEAIQADLPQLPGTVLAPTVGGLDEPAIWYATNELTRQVAARTGGTPTFLHSPALPGPELYETLLGDPATQRVLDVWARARCAILGVGAPLTTRTHLPGFVPTVTPALREAVGDICSRFYDGAGRPVPFPGSDRLMAMTLERLAEVPVTIALAAGVEKVPSILAAAGAGYFNELVTNVETAQALLAAA